MHKLPIKALSVNKAYRGRRFASTELKDYKMTLEYLLPQIVQPVGKQRAIYAFGVSSKGADLDNLVKCFQDCLSECYGFNDNLIYEISSKKIDVKKGEEFIEFDLIPIEE